MSDQNQQKNAQSNKQGQSSSQSGSQQRSSQQSNWSSQPGSESLAVIGPAAQAKSGTSQSSSWDALLQGTFHATGEEALSIAIFAPGEEQRAQQMASQTGGKVYRGNMSGQLAQQVSSQGSSKSGQSSRNPSTQA